jgi:signal transduction histidine kinase
LAKGHAVTVRDLVGLVHFAVPLILNGEQLGVIIAGQVFDQYPDQAVLEQAAQHFGLPPARVWQQVRLEYPITRAALRVYSDLLETLSHTFLQARYDAIKEAERLAEMTRLRDQAERARADAVRTEQALQETNSELEQRVQERTADLTTANHALRREIVERQRLEREAARAQHFTLLGRLAAGVSHEIRNPLASIALHIDLLEEELRQPSPESDTEIAQAFVEIKKDLTRLDDLVQDYLSLVRASTIQRDPVDLPAFMMQFAQEVAPLLAAQDISLYLDGLDRLGSVALHPHTFRRALLNLVQNAMDAMSQGGTLTLYGRQQGAVVQLEVRDTGSGIHPEQYAQIFEPLYTSKPGGTGLGLFIVQEVVAAHDGQVAVQSSAGHGTIFTITLPLLAPQESS